MDAGLSVIRLRHPETVHQVIMCSSYFFSHLNLARQRPGERLSRWLSDLVQDYKTIESTIEDIVFPLCDVDHWFMINISFRHRAIQLAEGLGWVPKLPVYETISWFLKTHLNTQMDNWQRGMVRIDCPIQQDGSSCGVIALGRIEQLVSRAPYMSWIPHDAARQRITWLQACIEVHNGIFRSHVEIENDNLRYGAQVKVTCLIFE